MSYLEASGIIFNVLISGTGTYAIWLFIIWPMVEAFSMCRWYAAIGKAYPSVKPAKGWVRVWWSCLHIGGRDFESTSSRYGRWKGVGRWTVNHGEPQS